MVEDRQTSAQQPGKGKPWATRYDDLGRTTTVTDPLSRSTIYDYELGRPAGDGQVAAG
ncbi:hypothetical protein ACFYRE_06220 [Actinoplanes missouriensis]|uniref:hypothetical protein n=1 Tax=Actinoplanes missouriensis TaxID=1866 RepID=UPI0036C22411